MFIVGSSSLAGAPLKISEDTEIELPRQGVNVDGVISGLNFDRNAPKPDENSHYYSERIPEEKLGIWEDAVSISLCLLFKN